jgi:hypothetical protein
MSAKRCVSDGSVKCAGSLRPLRKHPDRGGIAADIRQKESVAEFVACSPTHIRDHPFRSHAGTNGRCKRSVCAIVSASGRKAP